MIPSLDWSRPPLIKTKFAAPRLGAGLVSRPRLLNLLAEGLTRTLTLVCAPAGYGKTTLLAEWIASPDQAAGSLPPEICWLSLDPNDNDPALFLNYLIAALKKYLSPSGSASFAVLSVFPLPPIQTVLSLLINDLADHNDAIVLVLDDYQFIINPVINEGMTFFLDHLPANVHLVILTRSDPPIPFARLRVRGQLAEIRAEDLRFTIEETTRLLNQVMAFGLTVENVSQLDERTEGWAAGLQMAGLALVSQPDAALFVRNFSGSHRYILDYLIEEVLCHQPEDIQRFLLQTSILENLSGPLCDAVTAVPAGEGSHSSQKTLEYLERANLFLIALDSERTWYRYHHLFADLLRARLDQQDPEATRELHCRASRWYEQNQRIPEAIDHALAGGEIERASDLIEAQVPYRITHNGMLLLLGWIHRLPADMALSRPWLCIAQAWSLMFTNEVDQAEPLLQAAERRIPPDSPPGLQGEWRGQIACLRAAVAADIYGETQRTIEMAQLALSCLPQSDVITRTYAKYLLGRTFFLRGDTAQAVTILTENMHECIEADATNYFSSTLKTLSRIYLVEGRLSDAAGLLREGCAYLETRDPRQVTIAGTAFAGLADVLREWNHLEEAGELARRSLDLLIPWQNPSTICSAGLILVRVCMAQGRLTEAEAALGSAAAALRGRRPIAGVINDLNHTRVRFWLSSGQVQKASQWAHEQRESSASPYTHMIHQELDVMTLARVRITEEKAELALEGLERLAETAEANGRFGRLIEIHILQALAWNARGDQNQAFSILERALAFAEPEGYLRIFLDEGEPMREMLSAYLHTAAPGYRSYAQEILSAAAGPFQADAPANQGANGIDPLTPREIEILQAMAQGFSNRQIAQQLILAEGTVKFYVHSVLEKLGVHNRTQAIFEAKKRNLV